MKSKRRRAVVGRAGEVVWTRQVKFEEFSFLFTEGISWALSSSSPSWDSCLDILSLTRLPIFSLREWEGPCFDFAGFLLCNYNIITIFHHIADVISTVDSAGIYY